LKKAAKVVAGKHNPLVAGSNPAEGIVFIYREVLILLDKTVKSRLFIFWAFLKPAKLGQVSEIQNPFR
jgi:hypothetical protein